LETLTYQWFGRQGGSPLKIFKSTGPIRPMGKVRKIHGEFCIDPPLKIQEGVSMKSRDFQGDRRTKKEKQRYIDLYGSITRILHQNKNIIYFAFEDRDFGEVYCKAGQDTSFHFKENPNSKYHLQATLEAVPFLTRKGIQSLNNQLYIKKINPIPRRK
jgi:hypothetical protein